MDVGVARDQPLTVARLRPVARLRLAALLPAGSQERPSMAA